MSQLYDILKPVSKYWDHKNYTSQIEYNEALERSSTVYVGNLSFFTSQDSLYSLFSLAGPIEKIIMGINNEGNPCGFCFVKFEKRQDARYAVEFISKTKLGGRIIRVDWDPGHKEGREKGRGYEGQQRREDFRKNQDAERPKKRGPPMQNREPRYKSDRQPYEHRDRYQHPQNTEKSQRYVNRNRNDPSRPAPDLNEY